MVAVRLIQQAIGTLLLLGPKGGNIQLDLWKLGAFTTMLNLTSYPLVKTGGIGADSRGLQVCVQHPFAPLTRTINITKNGSIFISVQIVINMMCW
jgi:hypothetical protein